MKKFSRKYHLKKRQKAEKRLKRMRLIRAMKRSSYRAALSQAYTPTERYQISAPEVFKLSENYEAVAKFIRIIREQSIIPNRRYSIDFKTIKDISPAGALMLTAEIDRWRLLKGVTVEPMELHKWDPTVRRLLNEVGFFEVLGISNPCTDGDRFDDNDVTFLKFLSGTQSDGQYARQLRLAIEPLAGAIKDQLFMYNGLVEAMSNSVEHAYPEDQHYHENINRRWWMGGSFNVRTGRLTVMVYDQGVGIPATLPASAFWATITAFLKLFGLAQTDGNLIKAAMTIGKTQTQLENRGLGLNEMKEFIVSSGNGMLRVISGKGEYLFHQANVNGLPVKPVETVKQDHEEHLSGTLIAWEIYVGKDEEPNHN